jgi:hypothetical protein
MGVNVKVDCDFGLTLSHSGGYPGYGSHVLLLPNRGIGIFAFANRTYAAPSVPVWEAALELQRIGLLGSDRPLQASDALINAYRIVGVIFDAGDVTIGSEMLAMNFLLDRGPELRMQDLNEIKAEVGECDTSSRPVATGALAGDFTWRCERGRVNGRLLLAPTIPPRIQALRLAIVEP